MLQSLIPNKLKFDIVQCNENCSVTAIYRFASELGLLMDQSWNPNRRLKFDFDQRNVKYSVTAIYQFSSGLGLIMVQSGNHNKMKFDIGQCYEKTAIYQFLSEL